MGIHLLVENDIQLCSYYLECLVPYLLRYRRIVHATDHHSWLGSSAEFSLALRFGDKSTGIAAESPRVVERSFEPDFIAVIVVRGLAKCMQQFVWSGIWCLIAVAFISFC